MSNTAITARQVELSHPMGDRIAIFGRGGKTSLGKAIATQRDVPFIEIDYIHHMPDWQERPEDEIRQIITERLDEATNGWVYDGNHRPVQDVVTARANTVIVIDLSWRVMVTRYFKRSFKRCWTHEEIAGGNFETWRIAFASKDSHLLHMFRTRGRDYVNEFAPGFASDSIYYSIKTTTNLNDFYKLHGLVRDA